MNNIVVTPPSQNQKNRYIVILVGYDLPKYRQAAFQYRVALLFSKESLKWDEVTEFVKSISAEGGQGAGKR
jgi:hypothetical protein